MDGATTIRDRVRTALPALAFGLGLAMLATSWSEAAEAPALDKTGGAEPELQTVAQVADWVLASKDNGSLPFAIIDKGLEITDKAVV